jgi:hypothetical protein
LKWTAEEIAGLQELNRTTKTYKISMPGRTSGAIKTEIQRLGICEHLRPTRTNYKTALPPERWADMAWVLGIIDQAALIGRKTNINLRLLHGVLSKGR